MGLSMGIVGLSDFRVSTRLNNDIVCKYDDLCNILLTPFLLFHDPFDNAPLNPTLRILGLSLMGFIKLSKVQLIKLIYS